MAKHDTDDWERHAFQSTHLDHALYSPSRRELHLVFHNGFRYSYSMSPETWKDLKSAEHPGKFFRENIFRHYPGTRMPE